MSYTASSTKPTLVTLSHLADYFLSLINDWRNECIPIVRKDYSFRHYNGFDKRDNINQWMHDMKNFLLGSTFNKELYDLIYFMLGPKDLSDFVRNGSKVYKQFGLCGFTIGKDSTERILYVIRDSLTRIYVAAGYRDVLNFINQHYSEFNKATRTLYQLNGSEDMELLPLEHSLFLVRHSLEFHQTY